MLESNMQSISSNHSNNYKKSQLIGAEILLFTEYQVGYKEKRVDISIPGNIKEFLHKFQPYSPICNHNSPTMYIEDRIRAPEYNMHQTMTPTINMTRMEK